MRGFKIPDLVQVQFENQHRPGTYAGGSYTYIADHPLVVGDIVNVPTKYGEREAKVTKTNVSVGEIQCRVGQLLHITAPAIPGGDLFAGFLD